ncbi:MAG: helix-turn-helix transcriptional regulator [Flavobacteriales bacterium]
MKTHTLSIRNMVCDRCKAAVKRVLDGHSIAYRRVDLGEVELERPLDGRQWNAVADAMKVEGFELMDGRTAQLITRVKSLIIDVVHHCGFAVPKTKLSSVLSDALNKEYSSITSAFSEVEGITIEQYFLLQRIERVKELIRYDELPLNEIADRTGFSSAAHMSAQFKQLTGMTPSAFKSSRAQARVGLDKVGSSGQRLH